MVRRLIAGATTVEYSAHLIPEGGYNSMPPLYTNGMLIAGDAAQMINPTHREGSNLAMAAGRMAGETVIEAKKKGSFTAKTLSMYRKKLENSFVLKDMDDHKDIEDKVRENRDILTVYPKLLADAAHEYFLVDGLPKHDHQRKILRKIRKQRGFLRMFKDVMSLRHAIG